VKWSADFVCWFGSLTAGAKSDDDLHMGSVLSLVKRESPQCEGTTAAGTRCRFNSRPDGKFCGKHIPRDLNPVSAEEAVAEMSLAEKLDAVKQQVIAAAPAAMQALLDIMNDPLTKSQDRLKAIQMVLDRTVALKIEAEVANSDVRDIDSEIEDALAEAESAMRTGTDG
jgi:hypothetical protein